LCGILASGRQVGHRDLTHVLTYYSYANEHAPAGPLPVLGSISLSEYIRRVHTYLLYSLQSEEMNECEQPPKSL
jgi:hypothetical protein